MGAPLRFDSATRTDKSRLLGFKRGERSLADKLQEIAMRSPRHILAFHTLADMTLRFLNQTDM